MPQGIVVGLIISPGKEYHVYAKFIIRCAVSRLGVSMSKPHLWQEARGTGGDTAKLG
ncbi:RNA-directed DNA polymerase [Escherichia coli]|uniref:RNA-directed DNA polymerase n=1 Tax=Escherichia coli TaxID=562 RepID=A0A376UGW2_ECOLX|nr:RNA-directed DNA polymerase [Escherichia coli]